MKKVLSLLLSVVMLLSITAGIDFSAYADDYIEIWNIEDLYQIRYNMDANYRLMADIDMKNATAENGDWSFGGHGWNPIGSDDIYSSKTSYKGIFDGNGHTIIGMTMTPYNPNGSDGIYAGLFSNNSGTIQNLNFSDCDIYINPETNRSLSVGAVTGINSGTIINCNVLSGKIQAKQHKYGAASMFGYVGGIAGENTALIESCSNKATIIYNGSVSSNARLYTCCGGIVGMNRNIVRYSYNCGDITSTGYIAYNGGISGRTIEGTISDSYSLSNISASGYSVVDYSPLGYAGGISCTDDYAAIINCYSFGTMDAGKCYPIGGNANNCYYHFDNLSSSQAGATTLTEFQMTKSFMFNGFDFENIWIIDPDSDYPYPQLRSNRQSESEDVPPEEPSIDLENFKIKTVSLSLESSITMNYKVLKTAVADFENPYIEFTRNDKVTTVTDYTEQGDYFVFSYRDIAPQAMNDNVQAILYATYNDVLYNSEPVDFSVAQYAYGMLDKCSGSQYARLRTLLVDLLNYGAAAQIYQNYKTDALVNADLTDMQKTWASSQELNLMNVTDKACDTVENPVVAWKSVGLLLNDSVAVRYKFAVENVEDIQLRVTCGNSEWIYDADNFDDNGDGTYNFVFNDLNADKMQKDIYITAMRGDTAVSDTMRYSVESYAKQVQDSMPNSNLRKLTDAMMRYGISASNYA